MLERIEEDIRRHELSSPGQHLLIAVSGGADSVALLHAMHELSPRLGVSLGVCHLNHDLRAEAGADAAFVERVAKRLRLPVTTSTSDVRGLARRRRLSIEMAAREARYRFFARAARQSGAAAVATAHTADDEAETVLLKLARGAGPEGLSGIARHTRLKATTIVRPLLSVTRAEVLDFLTSRDLSWQEDESNRSPAFLRNRVRAEVLPLLETRLNPAVRRVLCRTADILRAENDWLDKLAEEILEACRHDKGGLDLEALRPHPLAARRRAIRLWLIQEGICEEQIDFSLLDRVQDLADKLNGTASAPLGGGRVLRRRYGHLGVETSASAVVPFRAVVNVPGETILPEQCLRIVTESAPGIDKTRGTVGNLPAAASISRTRVGRRRLYVRSWRAGDRIRPLGMQGTRKLQDVFVDAKVPSDHRDRIPVFECAGEVIWIPGYRVARGWEVTDSVAHSLQLHIERV